MSNMDTFWPKKAQNIYAWIMMIVMSMLPFSFVENENAKQYMRADAISLTTLMKYLTLLAEFVKKKIAKDLPQKFALVFDG
jgi:hypothetical protein